MLATFVLAVLAVAPALGLAAAVPVVVRSDASLMVPRQVPANVTAEMIKTTNKLEFEQTDESFMQVRETRNPDYNWLDWTSDGCAPAVDKVLWWNFRAACVRRDFGVRNFRAQNRLAPNLARINDQFGRDLETECHRHRWTKWLCRLRASNGYLKPVLRGNEPGSTGAVQMSLAEVNATALEDTS